MRERPLRSAPRSRISRSRAKRAIASSGLRLADPEDQCLALARARLELVAGLLEQVRNIDGGEWIGAFRDQQIAGLEPGQHFARAQRRQRTLEPAQIEGLLGHPIPSRVRRGPAFAGGRNIIVTRAMVSPPEHPQRIARLAPLDDVLGRIDALVTPVEPRRAEISAALGATLAEDIVLDVPAPPTALALRDGWALASELTADASSYTPAPLAAAVRINVGEALPPGVDAVAPLETVTVRNGKVEAMAAVAPGEGVLPQGGDVARAGILLQAGRRLGCAELAVLRAAGIGGLKMCLPRVRLARSRAGHDRVIDAAVDGIAGAIRCAGGLVSSDSNEPLERALTAAGADAVIAVGGTGAGSNDRTISTLASVGELIVHGVALVPAETTAFGMVERRPVLVLPGPTRCRLGGLAHAGPRHADAAQQHSRAAAHADGEAHAQSDLSRRARRARAGALRGPFRHPHSRGLCAALGAGAGQRLGACAADERRISGAQRGRDKTLAMTARFEPGSAARDLIAAIRRAARQEQFLEVVSAEEAQARFFRHIELAPLPAETLELAHALGRVLAHDVIAPIDVPAFDRANVDGFAVRAADTVGAADHSPRRLRLNGEVILCGHVPAIEVAAGSATTIATGGMVPRGADAVIMIEQTELIDESGMPVIELRRASAPGQFVSYAGSDIARGELVLRRRTRISSREIGMLAACGMAELDVVRRPRVAVLSTGDELAAPGERARSGAGL